MVSTGAPLLSGAWHLLVFANGEDWTCGLQQTGPCAPSIGSHRRIWLRSL